jgi:biopolymer transport protein ExbB/TolQ
MVVEKLLKIALLGASWVMYLMIALSIVSIGAMVERWLFYFKRNQDVDDLEEQLMKLLEEGDREGAQALLDRRSPAPSRPRPSRPPSSTWTPVPKRSSTASRPSS